MKLLFVYKYGILGGIATVLSQRFKALAAMGVQCDLACLHDQGLTRANGGFPLQSQLWIRISLSEVALRLKQGCYRALIVIDTPEALSLPQKYRQQTQQEMPLIYECHVPHPEGFLALKPYEALLNAHAQSILVPSTSSRAILTRLLPDFPPHRLVVLPNGLDMQHFTPRPPLLPSDSPEPARPKAPILLWIGKFKPDPHHLKNWGGFLDLLVQARQQIHPDLTGWMLGGATAQTEAKRALANEAVHKGLCGPNASAIRWFPSVPYPALRQVYQTVAASGGAHVMTSHHESFAMTAVEALLCGCPVISTPVGVLPELATWIDPPMLQVAKLNAAQTFDASVLSRILTAITPQRLSDKDDTALRHQFSIETAAHEFVRLLNACR